MKIVKNKKIAQVLEWGLWILCSLYLCVDPSAPWLAGLSSGWLWISGSQVPNHDLKQRTIVPPQRAHPFSAFFRVTTPCKWVCPRCGLQKLCEEPQISSNLTVDACELVRSQTVGGLWVWVHEAVWCLVAKFIIICHFSVLFGPSLFSLPPLTAYSVVYFTLNDSSRQILWGERSFCLLICTLSALSVYPEGVSAWEDFLTGAANTGFSLDKYYKFSQTDNKLTYLSFKCVHIALTPHDGA